jgi:hypothetical protein
MGKNISKKNATLLLEYLEREKKRKLKTTFTKENGNNRNIQDNKSNR